MNTDLYNQILDDTVALVQRVANSRKGSVALSRETVALLDRIRSYTPAESAEISQVSDRSDASDLSEVSPAPPIVPTNTDPEAALAARSEERRVGKECRL